jgi:hypothetical protein
MNDDDETSRLSSCAPDFDLGGVLERSSRSAASDGTVASNSAIPNFCSADTDTQEEHGAERRECS